VIAGVVTKYEESVVGTVTGPAEVAKTTLYVSPGLICAVVTRG